VLQRRFINTAIPCPSQSKGSHALRKSRFYSRTSGVTLFKGIALHFLPCGFTRLVKGLGQQG